MPSEKEIQVDSEQLAIDLLARKRIVDANKAREALKYLQSEWFGINKDIDSLTDNQALVAANELKDAIAWNLLKKATEN